MTLLKYEKGGLLQRSSRREQLLFETSEEVAPERCIFAKRIWLNNLCIILRLWTSVISDVLQTLSDACKLGHL
jgi:hypothetical protein